MTILSMKALLRMSLHRSDWRSLFGDRALPVYNRAKVHVCDLASTWPALPRATSDSRFCSKGRSSDDSCDYRLVIQQDLTEGLVMLAQTDQNKGGSCLHTPQQRRRGSLADIVRIAVARRTVYRYMVEAVVVMAVQDHR